MRGKPIGFGLSWVLARRKVRSFVLPGIILGTVILVLIGAYLLYSRFFTSGEEVSVSERPRLVVLPFENLGSPDDEYYADGITEEITIQEIEKNDN